jgi:hypothetical protein
VIGTTFVQDEIENTILTCENAECGQGFALQSPVERNLSHADEVVRRKAAEHGGWAMRGTQDLCKACAAIWLPEDGSTPPRPLPTGKDDRRTRRITKTTQN